jgi:hypothetical protein
VSLRALVEVSLYCFRQERAPRIAPWKVRYPMDALAAEIGRATGGVLFSKKGRIAMAKDV